jgi:hypothetical protein
MSNTSRLWLPQLAVWAAFLIGVVLVHVVYIGIYGIVLQWRESNTSIGGHIQHYQSARNLVSSMRAPVSGDAQSKLVDVSARLEHIREAHAELAEDLRWSVVEGQRIQPLRDVILFAAVSLACSVVLIMTSLVGAILLETYGLAASMRAA